MSYLQYAHVVILVMTFSLALSSTAVTGQRATADNHIAYYQQLLKRNPRSANAYYGLGDALIRKARESGDPDYFNRAEEAIKKSLEINPNNAGPLRHLAYVFYSRHEFEPAAIQARKAIAIDSAGADAYGILGDALLETGRYPEAEDAYRKMIGLEKNLYSYSRLAGLKSMRGDSAGALVDLETAIAEGKTAKAPAESIAWAEWQLASDHFMLGNLEKAEACYRRSMEIYPNYYRALSGLAQLRAAQRKYAEAIQLYQKAIAILPMPDYVAALGDIYKKTGREDLARQQYDLVEYIGRLNALNQILYNRELAYFYADHDIKPVESLELARRELSYRQDIYAYDLVAWSLYKNKKYGDARSAIEKALALGTKDAKLFYHAGMIYHSLQVDDKAREYLTRALSINPVFHPVFAQTAEQTLKQLQGGVEQARIESQR